MNLFTYGSADGRRGPARGPRRPCRRRSRCASPASSGWRRIWNVYRPDWDGRGPQRRAEPGDNVVGLLVEGLREQDLARLDTLEASHLPRETVYVEPDSGEAVPAQLYHRRTGNHTGRPSGRLKTLVLRARLPGGMGRLRERLPRHRGRRRRPVDLRLTSPAALAAHRPGPRYPSP